MENPYSILGIKEGASQEEIKSAYKKMVKKYHPDQYQNNPLEDLAQEKMKEINEAYNILTGKSSSNSNASYSNSSDSSYSNTSSIYSEAREYIRRRNYLKAEEILRSGTKNAEWYFLMGMIYLNKGWHTEGLNYIQRAVQMDPNNIEYRQTINNINMKTQGYRQASQARGYNSGSLCDACSCLLCSDCCCECMGSDLIMCC